MVKEANISESPWLKEGISRRTYYRNKANIGDSATISAKVPDSSAKRVPKNGTEVPNGTKSDGTSAKNGTPSATDGTDSATNGTPNGTPSANPCILHPDKPNDITRKMMEERIKAGQKVIPSWYKNEKNFTCREAAMIDVMNLVNDKIGGCK